MNRRGFTLLELMIVTLLLSLVAMIAAGPLMRARERAMVTAAKAEMVQTLKGFEMFQQLNHGQFPAAIEDLEDDLGFTLGDDMIVCQYNLTGTTSEDYRLTISMRHRATDKGVRTRYPDWGSRIDEVDLGECEDVRVRAERRAQRQAERDARRAEREARRNNR